MNAHDFIVEFGKLGFLPIDLEEHVVPALVKAGITDEIYPFYDAALPEGSLSGFFLHEEIPDQTRGNYRMATIGYGPGTSESQRLVACKEMLHLFDPKHCQVNSLEEIESLMEKIILPPDLVDPTSDGAKAFTDRIAIIQAVAVLFPMGARAKLLKAYKSKKLDIEQIAEIAELPRSIAAMVMSDEWPNTHANVLKVISHIHENGK